MRAMRALWSRLASAWDWLVPSDEALEAIPENHALIQARMADLRREQSDARRDRLAHMSRHEINAALARREQV